MVVEQRDPADAGRWELVDEVLQLGVGERRRDLVRRHAIAHEVAVAVLQLEHLQVRVHPPPVLDLVDVREAGVHVVLVPHEDRSLVRAVVALHLERPETDGRLAELRVAEPLDLLPRHRRRDRQRHRVQDREVGLRRA